MLLTLLLFEWLVALPVLALPVVVLVEDMDVLPLLFLLLLLVFMVMFAWL